MIKKKNTSRSFCTSRIMHLHLKTPLARGGKGGVAASWCSAWVR